MEAGFGRAVISMPPGAGLAGYFAPRSNRGVLDDLHARACLLRSRGVTTGVICLDLITVTSELDTAVRRAVEEAGHAFADDLIIAATHTHTGPVIRARQGRARSEEAFRSAVAGSAAAVTAAAEDLAPAALRAGAVDENPFAFNRRFRMQDGTVVTNPGKLNPEIAGPEGVVDREIGLLALERGGAVAGILLNIVNHTDTVGGDGVSADWPGFLERALRDGLGTGLTVITLIGAAGNINHFDVSDPEPQTSYAEARRIGRGYAEIVRKALAGLRSLDATDIRTGRTDVRLRRRSIPEKELSAARALLAGAGDDLAGAPTSEDLARGDASVKRLFARELVAFAEKEAGTALTYGMRCIGLGNGLGIVSLPGEPFTEIGLRIKERSPFATTFVVSHANGSHGYIPLAECFGRGGYEVLARPGAGLAEETAGVLVESAAKALGL